MNLNDNASQSTRALLAATNQIHADLAPALGVTKQQVGRRLAGTAPWRLHDVDAVATHFGIDPLAILQGPHAALTALTAPPQQTAQGS